MNNLCAFGGGDSCENGFEALHLAINSDFRANELGRQVILLISDSDPLPPLDPQRVSNPIYPTDMVDMDGLLKEWMGETPTKTSSCAKEKNC